MRISAGARKGLSFPIPKNLSFRPTLGRVKEALFDILSTKVVGAVFLDLYAGTGSVGLEAHSRGALMTIFVEKNKKTAQLLQKNVTRYSQSMSDKEKSSLQIFTISVESYVTSIPKNITPVDIIFADPPYNISTPKSILETIKTDTWLQPDGLVVIEHSSKARMNDKYEKLLKTKTYRYGDSSLSVYTPTTALR